MSKLQDTMMRRARASLERLVKLMEIDAPTRILQTEVRLLANRLRLVEPETWAQLETEEWVTRAKPANGFCAVADCDRFKLVDSHEGLCRLHEVEDATDAAEIAALPLYPEESEDVS